MALRQTSRSTFYADRSTCTVISGGQLKRAATPQEPVPDEV
jgi:hypothetical protein